MNKKRYVQRISGQGEKWLIITEVPHGWKVAIADGRAMGTETWFPKSEYRLCDPPEGWEDVSGSYEAYQVPYDVLHYNDLRLRKIDLTYEHCNHTHAFVIERRKS